MINFEATIKKAMRANNRVALSAYRSLQARVFTVMALPGPNRGRPITDAMLKTVVREEIRDRKNSLEFLPPTSDEFALNHAVIAILRTHLSK